MKPVLTAAIGNNTALLADILRLYVSPGTLVVDMTYGRGNFWAGVSGYRVVGCDKETLSEVKADLRMMPFRTDSIDCVVLDPPYAGGGGRHQTSIGIDATYNLHPGNNSVAIWKLYAAGMYEAHRMLRRNGVLIVKCQDQVESGKQVWVHTRVMNSGEQLGMSVEDLFVLVRNGSPMMRHITQKHARKNHSFFVVLKR